MYDISYSACENYEYAEVFAALSASLERVTDFSWLYSGMTVALKVNLVTFAKPEKAVTTHPVLVCALCDILIKHGAKVIVGDSSGGVYNAKFMNRIYSACGMTEVLAHGAMLNDDFTSSELRCEQGKICHSFDCISFLQNADAVINVCKLKTHGMMTLTAGVKNLFGAVPGVTKPQYHFRYKNPADFADMIIDIYEKIAPVLTICDGIVAMEGNGPTAGKPRKMGFIAVANNAHELDLSLSRVISLPYERVPTLVCARRRGLISENMSIFAEPEPVLDFDIPDCESGLLFEGDGGFFGKMRSAVMKQFLSSKPKLVKNKCVGCGECAEICPAKAIVMKNKRPLINRRMCICCFCCQEFCPKGALEVHRFGR